MHSLQLQHEFYNFYSSVSPLISFPIEKNIIISNSRDCIDYILKHLEVHQKYYNLLSVCKCGQTRPPVFDTSRKSEKCVMLTIRSGRTELHVRKSSCIIKSITQSNSKKNQCSPKSRVHLTLKTL